MCTLEDIERIVEGAGCAAEILRAADAYQSVTDWHTRVPPL